MIGWLADRWWVHKNRAALDQIDANMEALRVYAEDLDRRITESCGPDWREKAERRLRKYIHGSIRLE